MKLLLTGKNGQVGFELVRSLAVLGEVTAVEAEMAVPTAIVFIVRWVKEKTLPIST